jgi:hypothetical protein
MDISAKYAEGNRDSSNLAEMLPGGLPLVRTTQRCTGPIVAPRRADTSAGANDGSTAPHGCLCPHGDLGVMNGDQNLDGTGRPLFVAAPVQA